MQAENGIIAIDKQGDSILFLDAKTYTVLATIDRMPILPHELAISPDRRKAYVPAYGDGVHGENPHPNHVLTVIDLHQRRRLYDIDLSPFEAPHTLRFGKDGVLYVCCENSHAVVIVDSNSDRVTGSIETGSANTHRLAILPNSNLLFTDNEEDASISVIDLQEKRLINTIALPSKIAGIAASPDGISIVATDAEQPQLFIVDAKQWVLTSTIRLTGHQKGAQVARFSPSGKTLVVIGDHEPVVTLLDWPSLEQTALMVGNKPMAAACNFSETRLLVANEDDGTISIVDTEKKAPIDCVKAGRGCETLGYY
jgi:DNA-binding beta-propeller fold protein YncE